MGKTQSKQTRSRTDSGEEEEEERKIVSVIMIVLSYLLSAQDICRTSQVCSLMHKVVNENDSIWQQLCFNYSLSSPPYLHHERHLVPTSFFPSSKLPNHTWKQVFQQMVQYKSEMKEEMRKYRERYSFWKAHKRAGILCGGGGYWEPPSVVHISCELQNSFPGFPEHPGNREKRVLPFSVNLIRVAAMYIDLLKKVREHKTQFTDADFLAQALRRYINFLHLKHKYKTHMLVPTLEIEYVWICHMLRPSKYINDCTTLFGGVIDHSILVDNSYAYLNKGNAFEQTCELYYKEFGECYCEKIPEIPHFTKYGYALADAKKEEIAMESVDLDPENPPKCRKFIKLGPSYVGEIGIVEGAKTVIKSIGLRINDLLLDYTWLDDFEEYMQESLTEPLNVKKLFKVQTLFAFEPSRINSFYVYANLWKAYEKFLYMATKYPPTKGVYVHPSPAIDVIWHAHMICPKTYAKEVKEWTGYLVDHVPWPDCTSADLQVSVNNTDKLWKEEFGIAMHEEHTTLCISGSHLGEGWSCYQSEEDQLI